MIERYRNKPIDEIWSDEHTLSLWQKVELAIIDARALLGRLASHTAKLIRNVLEAQPIRIAVWKRIDTEIHHDLEAFVEERREFLPKEYAAELHKKTTSYDTEESALAEKLELSTAAVFALVGNLRNAIREQALKHRFTPMLARTHGQWAQIQSFGFMCLTWHEDLRPALDDLENSADRLRFSKMSGAIGNNAEIDPELEREALKLLGREPWHGATQIMPRIIYASLASGLARLVTQCEKIATDIRLGARSGYKIMEEPFKPNQKGSSAMPQKRNPIRLEQICGMGRVARGYAGMLEQNIVTWESRAIEQSCVERIAWPDLFHVTMQVLTVLTKAVKGLNVYPDAMMREIAASAGTYASNAAKTFLAEHGAQFGITPDDAYGIVRLAAHIAFEPTEFEQHLRERAPINAVEADELCRRFEMEQRTGSVVPESIERIIPQTKLHKRLDIDVSEEMVMVWRRKLQSLFPGMCVSESWDELFKPSRGMRNESHSFKKVFGV